MANTYSTELTSARSGTLPQAQPDGALVGGKLRRTRATITLASQAAADTITIAELPAGAAFHSGSMTTDTSLGSSTVAVGISGTAAKYKAAGTLTATDTPTAFGKASAKAAAPLAAPETIIATIAAASLPASGTLVIDILYTTRA